MIAAVNLRLPLGLPIELRLHDGGTAQGLVLRECTYDEWYQELLRENLLRNHTPESLQRIHDTNFFYEVALD